MVSNRRQWTIQTQGIWMLLSLVVLTAFGMLTPEFYFIVCLLGLLGVTLLFAPPYTEPSWWRRLQLVTMLGLVVFGYIVYDRVMTLIQPA